MEPKNNPKKPYSKHNPDQENNSGYGNITAIAFEVTTFNLVCIWGGYKLSQLYSPNTHWILILGVFFGITGTIYLLIKKTAGR